MPSTPPPNPKADAARAAMREYAGIPAVHIPYHAPNVPRQRPPLSASLLAQAERIEPGLFCEWTDDQTIDDAQPMTGAQLVTWRGTHASDEAAPAAEGEQR
jgi:hypothetical protein